MEVCQLWGRGRLAERPLEATRCRRTATYRDRKDRDRVKKPKDHVIWMTRKMPVKTLNRMRIIAAHMSKGRLRVPLWKVHQLALNEGVVELEKQFGVAKH